MRTRGHRTLTADDRLADRYRLLGRRGRGGMAEVFTAVDEVLQRRVAVKVLAPELADDPAAVARFRREARAAARLGHPAVVRVFDAASDHGTPFMVMELVEGPTLAERLRDEGRLSVAEALRVAMGICEGLEAAHRIGLVHRDVKPSNVLFTTGGSPRLADFGIAETTRAGRDGAGPAHGSVPYVAPEQIRGGPVDARSDLYALGCVLFEMLVGRPPFQGPTPEDVISQHLERPAPAPGSLRPEVPGDLDVVVRTALAKQPAARHPDVAALREDLERVRAGQPVRRTAATVPLPDGAPTVPVASPARGPDDQGGGRDDRGSHGRLAPLLAGAAVVAALVAAVVLTGAGGWDLPGGWDLLTPEDPAPTPSPPSVSEAPLEPDTSPESRGGAGSAGDPENAPDPGQDEEFVLRELEDTVNELLSEQSQQVEAWQRRREAQRDELRRWYDELRGGGR